MLLLRITEFALKRRYGVLEFTFSVSLVSGQPIELFLLVGQFVLKMLYLGVFLLTLHGQVHPQFLDYAALFRGGLEQFLFEFCELIFQRLVLLAGDIQAGHDFGVSTLVFFGRGQSLDLFLESSVLLDFSLDPILVVSEEI